MSASVDRIQPVDPRAVQEAVNREYASRRATSPLSDDDISFIRQNMNLNVPPQYNHRYKQLLIKYHDVFSRSKQDLGRSNTLQHEIQLRTKEPVYVKQFKIPDAHREVIEKHVKEWLALGIVEPARSRYNSPMFCVGKKDGSLRLVQDFRALNSASMDDKYTMKDVTECIGEKVFLRLRQHKLKVNLKKCIFGDQNVAYLGFRLTPQGIKPGQDKLKAVE